VVARRNVAMRALWTPNLRPVYWQKPLPAPPPDLASLHFAFPDL
jgi:hypothetical protein